MCGVVGSPSVVGRGNGGGGGAPYRLYLCCKESLGTHLSNICIKLEKLHTQRYLSASSR
jgi:hypothetical protein